MKKKRSRLSSSLRRVAEKQKRPKEPLWKGPETDGVTQSMLSGFLVCRERFRLHVIEGLAEADAFNHSIEYGNMWHACEEAVGDDWSWKVALTKYTRELCEQYPLQREQIVHWHKVCAVQFPIYLEYWKKTESRKDRKSLLREYTFRVPYELPSGRTVLLRGKMDGVDLVGRGKAARTWLKEHKTKGDIKEELLRRQLTFDLQTMFYLTALIEILEAETAGNSLLGEDHGPPAGVLYNTVRRPLSGGKGSITRLKERQYKNKAGRVTRVTPAETPEHFYERVAAIIEGDPSYFFMRWEVRVTRADVDRFKREFLDPILEQLCDWWDWISSGDPWEPRQYNGPPGDPPPRTECGHNPIHFRHPYGTYNPMAMGRPSEMDEYLATGNDVGLARIDTLFKELE